MKKSKKIAVIGGNGKSGKYLVKQLLIEEFPLKLLFRNPHMHPVRNPLIEVVERRCN